MRGGFTNPGYEVTFHPWQCRLLMSTSVYLVCVALTALLYFHQPFAASSGLVSSTASFNYWRAPGPSWRRDADVLFAVAAITHFCVTASTLSGIANVGAWIAFACFGCCFRRSWVLSAAGDDAWAIYHGGGHTGIGVATLFMAAGDGDAWLRPHNPERTSPFSVVNWPALLSVATVALAPLYGREAHAPGRSTEEARDATTTRTAEARRSALGLRYLLTRPRSADASDASSPSPLLLYLHGARGRGTDPWRLLEVEGTPTSLAAAGRGAGGLQQCWVASPQTQSSSWGHACMRVCISHVYGMCTACVHTGGEPADAELLVGRPAAARAARGPVRDCMLH